MEMFIVSSGAVQVVGGPGDSIVFVTLGQVRSKLFTLVHYKIFTHGPFQNIHPGPLQNI